MTNILRVLLGTNYFLDSNCGLWGHLRSKLLKSFFNPTSINSLDSNVKALWNWFNLIFSWQRAFLIFLYQISFSSILVTWFLVVFGDEVTKVLPNSLFTFLLSKARQAKWKFKVKKIMKPKWRKKQNWSYQNL